MFRRHHLVDEAKSELELAWEAVRRGEESLAALAHDLAAEAGAAPSARYEQAVQAQTDLNSACQDAVHRFSIVSASFGAALTVDDPDSAADRITRLLFRSADRSEQPEIAAAVGAFVASIKAFSRGEWNATAERAVRDAWAGVEAHARHLGRSL